MLENHKFIHYFRSGKKIGLEIIREENKMPVFKDITDDKIETLMEKIEYSIWRIHMEQMILLLLTEKEIDLLAEEGRKKLGLK